MHIIFPVVLFLLCSVAEATTYTVSIAGNDGNPGSLDAPYRTIAKAVSVAKSGDIVQVRKGTYNESLTINSSGITITGYADERPVLDGQNKIPGQWYGMFYVNGANVQIKGFEIANSAQRGIVLHGINDTVSNVYVHDSRENGILIDGDNCVVEDSVVTRNAMSNYNSAGNGMWSGGLNAARGDDSIASRNIIRRNKVFNNWGEGLSTFEADGTVIEDNVVYDNYSVNLYISDTRNALVQRNIVYNTAAAPLRGGNPPAGVAMWDEVASKPRSTNNKIINNLIRGSFGVHTWDNVPAFSDESLVAHNTVVSSAIAVGSNGKNTRVVNNLNNAQVRGGDIVNVDYFRLFDDSPVGLLPDVLVDYLNVKRRQTTTAGAIEFASSTPQPIPTNIALNKPATASSREASQYDASFAVDSDLKTRWSSQFSDPQWIQIDLQKIYNLDSVRLTWERAKSSAFTIQTSIDLINWITLHDAIATSADVTTIAVKAAGRYVRLVSTKRATQWGISLFDISMTGTQYPCE